MKGKVDPRQLDLPSEQKRSGPTAALGLPSRCPVLTLPSKGETIYPAAAYDLVTGAEESGPGVAHQ